MTTITDPILGFRYDRHGAVLTLMTPTGVQELAIIPDMLVLPDEPCLSWSVSEVGQPASTMTASNGEEFHL